MSYRKHAVIIETKEKMKLRDHHCPSSFYLYIKLSSSYHDPHRPTNLSPAPTVSEPLNALEFSHGLTLDNRILRYVRQALSTRMQRKNPREYDGWLSYSLLASVRPDSSDPKGNSPNPCSSSVVQVGEQRDEFQFACAPVLSYSKDRP